MCVSCQIPFSYFYNFPGNIDKFRLDIDKKGSLNTIGGIVAPISAGILISKFHGMIGYYVVFIATCVFLFVTFLVSLKVKGKPNALKSYFEYGENKKQSGSKFGFIQVEIQKTIVE